jgi:hypothetical protein
MTISLLIIWITIMKYKLKNKTEMNLQTILSSIIAAASTLIAVGFPFIIFIVANHNNKKEKLLLEMKLLYQKFKPFRELIYYAAQIDFWKNKNIIAEFRQAIQKGDIGRKDTLIKENCFLGLFQSYEFISNQYQNEIMRPNTRKIFTYNEIEEYKIHINNIWHKIDSRTDIIKEIDIDCFRKLDDYNFNRIKKVMRKLETEYSTDAISINVIANIAGEIEVKVIDLLSDLALSYESPIGSIVKRLFWILTVTLIFGVILPLLLLILSSTYAFYATIVTAIIMIICFITIIILTGKYIGIL